MGHRRAVAAQRAAGEGQARRQTRAGIVSAVIPADSRCAPDVRARRLWAQWDDRPRLRNCTGRPATVPVLALVIAQDHCRMTDNLTGGIALSQTVERPDSYLEPT